jgi:DUF1680 family protein
LRQISRRHILGLLGLLAGESCRAPSREDGSPLAGLPRHPVADALTPFSLRDARLGGSLGRRLDLCIRNRIFAQDPGKLVEPFRRREERSCWQTEFWGKWFMSAAAACEYTGNNEWRERLARSVHELLATQSPDGYIGNYAPDSHLKAWDVWGRKYTLLGLLAWWDLAADPAALAGARSLADHLLREVGPDEADIVTLGMFRGMAASSVLEPVVMLCRRTRDQRYLRFAEYILQRWSSPEGPQLIEKAGVPVAKRFPPPKKWWSWENGQKAYEMMSCYSGLLGLYQETGWQPGLDAAARTFESIRDTEINVAGSGSAMECWYGGRAHQTGTRDRPMETCVGVTWMQLCAHLLQITGEPRFADEIERTAYNALAGAMTPDGSSFAQYNPLQGTRSLGERHCGMGLNCCVANGPRGMMLLPKIAVMLGAKGPAVSLYSDGVWSFLLPSGVPCRLEVKTDYPVSGQVDIRIEPARAESFALRLRVPQWSEETSLAVNGKPAGVRPGTWAVLDRRWKPSDRVSLSLDLRGRILREANGDKRYVAVVRGPVALARDLRLGGDGIDEPVKLQEDERGFVSLKRTPPPAGVQMAFAAGGVILCDYASAGNTWDARSRYRTWMRSS